MRDATQLRALPAEFSRPAGARQKSLEHWKQRGMPRATRPAITHQSLHRLHDLCAASSNQSAEVT
jgi:hypothetical protein